jgi:hypothetical protein
MMIVPELLPLEPPPLLAPVPLLLDALPPPPSGFPKPLPLLELEQAMATPVTASERAEKTERRRMFYPP